MEKTYNPELIEAKFRDIWEQGHYFSSQLNSNSQNAYSIVLPPPNVTGSLHMGHAFQHTIMDVLTRYHRGKGDQTLWQPGTDHAGIATQMVVERQLERQNISRHDLGREKFTEKVWQDFKFSNYFKTPLMFKDWDIKGQSKFGKSYNKIDWLINLVTSIRSTKVDLNVSPGSFIDISVAELNSEKIRIIDDNLDLFKRLGRVSNISHSELNKNGIKIIVDRETLTLYFDQNLDLNEQKQKISNKAQDLENKILRINDKMKNKSFLKNAPKQIVQKEKKALIEYKTELKKLNSILNSIKN